VKTRYYFGVFKQIYYQFFELNLNKSECKGAYSCSCNILWMYV